MPVVGGIVWRGVLWWELGNHGEGLETTLLWAVCLVGEFWARRVCVALAVYETRLRRGARGPVPLSAPPPCRGLLHSRCHLGSCLVPPKTSWHTCAPLGLFAHRGRLARLSLTTPRPKCLPVTPAHAAAVSRVTPVPTAWVMTLGVRLVGLVWTLGADGASRARGERRSATRSWFRAYGRYPLASCATTDDAAA